MTGLSAEHLLAAAYLSRVAEPASVPLWHLVLEHGYEEAAALVRSGQVPAEVAAATEARRESASPQADLDAALRYGIRLLTPEHAEWPHFGLAALQACGARRSAQWQAGHRARPPRGELIPPLALWVRGAGNLAAVGVHSLAVVGARAATAYGEHVASEFGYGLGSRGVVIVSGGAYGIDAAAHRGVVAADGPSVLVSAGGLDRPYPAGNRLLYDRTAERGVLVSERPPGSAPHRQRFLSRNRLIAALGTATVVVEAGVRSGALNTAGYARDLGRPVLAVPGSVTSAMSAGCHALLRRDDDPARLVTSVADVLEYCAAPAGSGELPLEWPAGQRVSGGTAVPEIAGGGAAGSVGVPGVAGSVGTAGGPPAHQATGSRSRPPGWDCLDVAARSVLDGFPRRRTVTEAELSRLSGQPIGAVIAALPILGDLGLITRTREGYRLAT